MDALGQLTERDLDIIEACYRCRVLTTHQIERRYFANLKQSARVCRRVCKRLVDRQFLESDEQPTKMGEGSAPRLHYLSHHGVKALRRYRGYDEVDWQPDGNHLRPVFVPHRLAVNDFRLACELDARRLGLLVLDWHDEDHFKREDFREYVLLRHEGGEERHLFHPDGYGVIVARDKQFPFFLELDRGTERSLVWRRKVETYQQYFYGKQYERRFGLKAMRVVTVTTSVQRMRTLVAATVAGGGKRRYLFTTNEEMRDRSVLADPIWLPATGEEKVPLVPATG